MALIDEINTTWEPRLGELESQLWMRMKRLGVEARWVDPLNGRTVHFTEQINDGVERRAEASEFFDFVVTFKGEVLVSATRHLADYQSVVISALVQAANKLEERGIPVLR